MRVIGGGGWTSTVPKRCLGTRRREEHGEEAVGHEQEAERSGRGREAVAAVANGGLRSSDGDPALC